MLLFLTLHAPKSYGYTEAYAQSPSNTAGVYAWWFQWQDGPYFWLGIPVINAIRWWYEKWGVPGFYGQVPGALRYAKLRAIYHCWKPPPVGLGMNFNYCRSNVSWWWWTYN